MDVIQPRAVGAVNYIESDTLFTEEYSQNTSVSNTDQLIQEFDNLSAACVAACEAELGAAKDIGTRLAEACLLYRKLENSPSALAQIYAREGFGAPDLTSSAPHLTTYVKVLFRVDLLKPTDADKTRQARFGDQTVRNKVDGYAASLARMHAEYCRDPEAYRRNGTAKLAKYHQDAGGIQGAKDARAAGNTAAKNAKLGLSTSFETDHSAVSAGWLTKEAHAILMSTAVPPGGMSFAPSALNFSGSGAAICIVYDLGNGTYGLVPAVPAASAVQVAAFTTAAALKHVQGLPLRILAEVIATQRYPKQFAPSGSRLNLDRAFGRWHRDVYLEVGASGHLASRRLTIRKDDILLSATDMKAGVATVLRPKQHIMPSAQADVWMDDLDLRRFEHLLDTQTVPAFTCKPIDKLQPAPNGCSLKIDSLAAGVGSRDLLLADYATTSETQVEPDLSHFVPEWMFAASSRWFRRLRDDFLTPWFKNDACGNKLSRQEHMALQIEVTATRFRIECEIDGTGNHPAHEAAGINATGASAAPVLVGSKDLAPILHNLPDLDLVGDVKVSGNSALLLFEFATDIGEYTIAVPTVTVTSKKLVRNPAHMRQC